jgi:hypothetical protein
MFRLEADGGRVQRIELIPTLIRHRQMNCAAGPELKAIAEWIEALSAELATTIVHEGQRPWIEAATPLES